MTIQQQAEDEGVDVKKMAEDLGKQVGQALMGVPDPTEERIKEVMDTAYAVRDAHLHLIHSIDHNPNSIQAKMDRLAAEGLYAAAFYRAKIRNLRWRIERKAKSCAGRMMEAKRKDEEKCKIYGEAYGVYRRYVEEIMPEDVNFGLSFGRRIMDRADEEIKAFWGVEGVKEE